MLTGSNEGSILMLSILLSLVGMFFWYNLSNFSNTELNLFQISASIVFKVI